MQSIYFNFITATQSTVSSNHCLLYQHNDAISMPQTPLCHNVLQMPHHHNPKMMQILPFYFNFTIDTHQHRKVLTPQLCHLSTQCLLAHTVPSAQFNLDSKHVCDKVHHTSFNAIICAIYYFCHLTHLLIICFMRSYYQLASTMLCVFKIHQPCPQIC